MKQKQIGILIICTILFFSMLPFSATAKSAPSKGKYDTKDEVIYGNLNGNGVVAELYVVNSFSISKKGDITDFGNYSGVRNLTDLSDISLSNNKVHFEADSEKYFYQGELEDTPLPWDISIKYMLDGVEIKPNELAGQSGHLDIQITTAENKQVDPVFFDYYVLQISLTLDPLTFKNIQAPEATEANEGKNKNYSFTIMPEQEEEFIISADVDELEMDPIDISAVPANIAMEDPDITGMKSDMRKLADGVKEINNGVKELANGLAEWKNGAVGLEDGSHDFKNGIEELDNSSDELVDGSAEILEAMEQISHALKNAPDMDALGDLDDIKDLPSDLREAAKKIREFSKGLEEIEGILDDLSSGSINDKQFEEALNALKDSGNQELVDTTKQLEKMYRELLEAGELDVKIPDNATDIMTDMANELENFADEIDNGMDNFEQLGDLEALQRGFITMAQEYKTFHQGLINYTGAVHELAVAYEQIDQGISGLTDGAASLEDGARRLQEGTQELQDKTADLPNDMQSELDKMLEEFDFSNFEPVSFVSDKNKKVDVVQFVLQTEKIEMPEAEKTVTKQEKKSLWDRFLDLFR